MPYEMDRADIRLISELRRRDRPTVTELARVTNMARGTVQTRLARLVDVGAITGWGPEVSAPSAGYAVTAFTTLSIAQGTHDDVVEALAGIPEVLEVHVVTGGGDLLCRIAARSNDHLHELIQQIVHVRGVVRTESHLSLNTPVQRTVADLVAAQVD